ncbi:recombinase family protein [Alicyclobacillus dauci]|uniref:Recombinase family protein n=1 Tax=Alicyclobacillus dauci TaxID=1475485 RepID=A0ABY6YZ24_9BACL|nr:recombinase family protein [Alicyclobacillus dauci]WAH35837.1 recombinase family protein [Alicyclobacillus dauci]
MRIAIYIRVSTGLQAAEGHSLDVQLEQCLSKVDEMGGDRQFVDVFREAGVSGEDMDRPELMRLLDLAKQGNISHVVVKHPDRLSRNVADKAIIVRELQKSNVSLVFVDVPDWDKTDEAHLLFNIIASIAEYELRQIRRRTLTGKLRAVRDGQLMPMGIDPYGYRYESGKLVVVEEEAAIVREIYRLYIQERLSLRAIAKRLDAIGAPTKTRQSMHWSHATVQRILSNEIYTGRYYYNRRITAKVRGVTSRGRTRHRRVKGWREAAEWIEIHVPNIIDEEWFELAKIRRHRTKRGGLQKRHHHLLQGRITCALCRRHWHAAAYESRGGNAYRFYRRPPERDATSEGCRYRCRALPAAELEEHVWACVVESLIRSRAWHSNWRDRQAQLMERAMQEEADLARQRQHLLKRRERLFNLYMNGDVGLDEYNARRADLETHLAAIERQMEESSERAQNLVNMSDDVINQLNDLLLESRSTPEVLPFDLRQRIVQALVTEILLNARGARVDVSLAGAISELSSL